MIYHPKILKLFNEYELEDIMKDSIYSLDKSKRVDVIVSLNTKIDVEIYTDCEAKSNDKALISILDDRGYNYPKVITKEIFIKAFYESMSIKVTCITAEK